MSTINQIALYVVCGLVVLLVEYAFVKEKRWVGAGVVILLAVFVLFVSRPAVKEMPPIGPEPPPERTRGTEGHVPAHEVPALSPPLETEIVGVDAIPEPSDFEEKFKLAAEVRVTDQEAKSSTPLGALDFFEGGIPLCSAEVRGDGQADCIVARYYLIGKRGQHYITAVYTPSDKKNFVGCKSASPFRHEVR
jgi:hypothetical protein